jgi:sugar lactone lactonase YvrE
VVETPTSRPTCGGFGGPSLNRFFLASGWEGLESDDYAAEPHAGSLFVRHAAVPGRPVARLRLAPAATGSHYW